MKNAVRSIIYASRELGNSEVSWEEALDLSKAVEGFRATVVLWSYVHSGLV